MEHEDIAKLSLAIYLANILSCVLIDLCVQANEQSTDDSWVDVQGSTNLCLTLLTPVPLNYYTATLKGDTFHSLSLLTLLWLHSNSEC